MQKFISDGTLIKIQGKGTFVRQLKNKTLTNRIAIIHCHSSDGFFNSSFYSAIMAGIEDQAQKEKKVLLVNSFANNIINPEQIIELISPIQKNYADVV